MNVSSKPITGLDQETSVELWHPIGRAPEEILAWRGWIEDRQIRQPFKQAHREVYLLTDAERNTAIYSNRFAGHLLKQHQFNALCSARGWRNKLRLNVDADFPPAMLPMPSWNMRAEFWIENVGEPEFSSVYEHVATDQVRFYPRITPEQERSWQEPREEPMPLEQVPPLVLSEVLRDVDLFVGVTSVGNDPNWSDGGPDGQYRQYWQDYAFGELTTSATIRRQLLERVIPKLKIATQCELADKFLVVRGKIRTYRIHLGSGNVMMDPDNQYLCIVAAVNGATRDRVFLPFDGDHVLSVILSKAFLLAEDSKITDQTILSQIHQNR